MKKILTLILFLLSFLIVINAKTVFVAASGNNTTGDSWTNALTSIPNNSSSAISAGDSVFVKTGTYSLSQSTAGSSCFATKADVNYLGGFAGSETYSSQRAKSDLDNNGIIEPWEFTNAAILNLTATNNAYGLFLTANTATRVFDGFKFNGSTNFSITGSSGTYANSFIKLNGFVNFQNNIIASITFTESITTTATWGGTIQGGIIGSYTAPCTINNCLIEKSTANITCSGTQTDNQMSPIAYIAPATTTARNICSNLVFRNNNVTLDFTSASSLNTANQRGMILSMYTTNTASSLANTIKNVIIHNNTVLFTPKTGSAANTNLGNGGLLFVDNAGTVGNKDSIVNCTVANNKMTRIGYGIRVGYAATTGNAHIVANNVSYQNLNYGDDGITSTVKNFVCWNTGTNTANLVGYNIANGGFDIAAATGVTLSNLTNLASTNTGTNPPYFSNPTTSVGANRVAGSADSIAIAQSRWSITSSSYLKGKGIATANKYDKAGQALASTPSVGAYENKTYNIAASAVTGGSVSGANATADYGSSITLSATPSSGYLFSNWTESGTVVSSSASYTFVITASRSLVANFVASSVSITPTTLSSFSYVYGAGPSTEKSFTITGSGLSTTISVTPAADYEISTGTGGSFVATNPISITPSSGSVNATINVRLKAGLTAASYSTSENIGISSSDFSTQTVACTGSVTKASQSISFGALSAKTFGDADFAPGATSATSGTNAITYASSNTSVATIVSGQIHIVGVGSTNITASQAASTNYSAATDAVQSLSVSARSFVSTFFVDGSSGSNSNNGTSWATAVQTITQASTLAQAGDNVYVKSGTYSYSGSLTTKSNVNYYGSFTGTESLPSDRTTSDLDGNSIVEPWEFANPTLLSFTLTSNTAGLVLTSNTVSQHYFDGFKISGTHSFSITSGTPNRCVLLNDYILFQNNTISDWTVTGTVNSSAAWDAQNDGTMLKTAGSFGTINNCMIEKNTVSITRGASEGDYNQVPFILLNAGTTGRNIMSNCILRKNQVTMDYSAGTNTGNNTRGLLILVYPGAPGAYTTLKNTIVHNNEVTFLPNGTLTTLGTAGLIHHYATNNTYTDSIYNCTVANNNTTKIGTAGIMVGLYYSDLTRPSHIVLNNVLYNNKNGASVNNLLITNAVPSGANSIIKNNITNGGQSNGTNVGGSSYLDNNLYDLSSTNTDATKGANFVSPSTVIGYSTNTSVAISNWKINPFSYLSGKGISIQNFQTDKAGVSFANPPTVGAYENTLRVSVSTLSAFTYQYGAGPSSEQTFTVNGSSLSSNVSITPPNDYEISTSTGSGFQSTAITLTPSSGSIGSTTIYVRLKSGLSTGSFNSENITVACSGLPSQNIVCSGSVSKANSTISVSGSTSFTYNGSAQGPSTSSVTGSTGTVTYSYAGVGYGPTDTAPTNAGSYTVTASVAADTNYNGASSSATAFSIFSTGNIISDTNVSSLTLSASSDLSVSAGYTLTIDANTTVNSVTVAPGAKLTLNNSRTLTTGSLTLQSDANGTATLMDANANGGLTVSGTAAVKQYLTSGRNWYISSPLSGATSAVFSATNVNPLYYYDETIALNASSNAWAQIKNTGTALSPTTGYIANMDATVLSNQSNIVTFTGGNLNTGTITTGQNGVPALTYTDNNYKKGFNLVGNPYPSYLDWDNVTKTNVMGSIWLRTKVSNTYLFDTYNASGQLGTSNSGIPVNNHIPPMQAFWVRATSSGASLGFDNSMRSHKGSQITGEGVGQVTINDRVFKAPVSKDQLQSVLRLQISNGLLSDETILYSNPNALNSFDDYDTPKMFSNSSSLAEIYTVTGTEQLAINGLNSIAYDTEFPLGFTTLSTGNFSIKASQIANFPAGTQVILKDNADTNSPVITDLTDGSSYSFSSGAISNNTSRFALIFRAPSVATGINTESNGNVWISTCNGQLVINGAGNGASLEVFNAVGQKLISKSLTRSAIQTNKNLPAGAYIVKVTNEGKSITRKIIID